MSGWAYAVGLLLCPSTVALLILWRKREKGLGIPWLLAGLTIAYLLFAYIRPYTAHGCGEGMPPWTMVLLPLGSLVVALWRLRPWKLGFGIATVMGIAFVAMTLSWVVLVHEDAWTGNPDETHAEWRALEPWTMALENNPAVPQDTTEYLAGWLDESPIVRRYPVEAKALDPGGRALIPLPHAEGHTILSGLYAVRPTRVRWWYPGGHLVEGMHRVVAMRCD